MNYLIIHINDRSKKNIEYNKKILKDFNYISNVEFFNGNIGNAGDVLNHKGINLNSWDPYDGRKTPPLPGELGIWVSLINVWEYIVSNKIEKTLVLEDDVLLQNDFVKKINNVNKDLPKDFDFLSLYYFEEQNKITEETEIGSDYIHKSNNQYSAGQATVYSYLGAKKLLRLAFIKGIQYTTDCFIFKQAQEGLVNGFSIKKEQNYFLKHDYKKIKSLIDPENLRNTSLL